MTKALAAITIALLGCGAEPSPEPTPGPPLEPQAEVSMDPLFTAEESAEVSLAFLDWHTLTGWVVQVTLTSKARSWRIVRATLPRGMGRTSRKEKTIVIDAEAIVPPGTPMWSEFRLVVAHELGHALGMGHWHEENDLMHEHIGEDMKPAAERWAGGIAEMTWALLAVVLLCLCCACYLHRVTAGLLDECKRLHAEMDEMHVADEEFMDLWLYAKDLISGFESGTHPKPEFEELRKLMLTERNRRALAELDRMQ